MTPDESARRMADRLAAVDWTLRYDRTYSRLLLMSEYLRRAAWWAQHLQCEDDWPFFDIAARVCPGIRANETVVAALGEQLQQARLPNLVRDTCAWAVHWAYARVTADGPSALDDPFEPLVMLYERGGPFTLSTGFVDIDGAGVPRKTWRDHLKAEPVVALDHARLDQKDAARRA
ncbi:hypothetical protein [Couchioplanes azureus]|uniref:hypothetical protein n=1 Tax=Couchioplanes caeruleus TaxID=56438 RepID=UPI0016713022|nr:hypothetical protein [Couchioplanes caeruleus]GGQ44578.1 hypothetical protein GCM10010166_11410 [Couchioplanes caeruleus subsp. azureus]